MPLARNEDHWLKAGKRVFKTIVVVFAALGLLAGFAVARSGNAVVLGGFSFSGWSSLWIVTAMMAVAGGLFGAVWLLIFRALAVASRR